MTSPPPGPDHPAPPALASAPTTAELRLRITAGILYAACRFVPVPLVDDLLREQITGWMVRATLPGALPRKGIEPLWSSSAGCLGGCLGSLLWVPVKLLLFPIRKILSVVLGVRWVSRDLAEMLLLGRVLDHAVQRGLLGAAHGGVPSGGGEARDVGELARQSRELRRAFDVALSASDTRFLGALFATALCPIRGLVAAALRTLRSLRRERAEAPTLTGDDKVVIEGSVSRIEALLAQPEVKRFIAEFDVRVLENLEELARRRAAAS
jgi:hypothetical protein